jgi:nitric oxide reductase subunit B
MDQAIVHLLIWMRMPGDTIFAVGALLFAWFVLRLWIAPRKVAARIGNAAEQRG